MSGIPGFTCASSDVGFGVFFICASRAFVPERGLSCIDKLRKDCWRTQSGLTPVVMKREEFRSLKRDEIGLNRFWIERSR